MPDTPLARIPRDRLPADFHAAWDTLNALTGEPTFVEVFAAAPDVLDFVMNDFYARLFFGGNVDNRYKQLARLKLSLEHGCRTCNKQNVPGAREAGISEEQIEAITNYESGPFSDADICELGTVMAVIAGMAKLSFVMRLVEKESYCPFAPPDAAG
jgi:alkylhydroperoxidase family enzyme